MCENRIVHPKSAERSDLWEVCEICRFMQEGGISRKGGYTLSYARSVSEEKSHKRKSKQPLVVFLKSLRIRSDVSLTLYLSACWVYRSIPALLFSLLSSGCPGHPAEHLEGSQGHEEAILPHLITVMRKHPAMWLNATLSLQMRG